MAINLLRSQFIRHWASLDTNYYEISSNNSKCASPYSHRLCYTAVSLGQLNLVSKALVPC